MPYYLLNMHDIVESAHAGNWSVRLHSTRIHADHALLPLQSGAALPCHTPTGTNFLEAFQSCRFMNPGAKRRISASTLACPGRISSLPFLKAAKVCFQQLIRGYQRDQTSFRKISG
jgi:hypothetical protein